jgi:hypothetical protein
MQNLSPLHRDVDARAGEKRDGHFVGTLCEGDVFHVDTTIPGVDLNPSDMEMIVGKSGAFFVQEVAEEIRSRVPDSHKREEKNEGHNEHVASNHPREGSNARQEGGLGDDLIAADPAGMLLSLGHRKRNVYCAGEGVPGRTGVFGLGTTGAFGLGTTEVFWGGTTGVFGPGTTGVLGLGTTGVLALGCTGGRRFGFR